MSDLAESKTPDWPWDSDLPLATKLHYSAEKEQCPYVDPEDCTWQWYSQRFLEVLGSQNLLRLETN